MLTSSSGTNYVPNEHEDVDQYDSYARFWPMWLIYNTIQDSAILKPPNKFGGLIG